MPHISGHEVSDWPEKTTNFVPYVGTHYWKGFKNGLRFLIVGESHYDPNGSAGDREYTRATVEGCITDKNGNPNLGRLWGPLNMMLTGSDRPTGDDVRTAWDTIAYMNYVQCIVGEKGQSPKFKEMWKTGEPALKDAIRILCPHRVLVLGSTNWGHIKWGSPIAGSIRAEPSQRLTRNLWQFPSSDDSSSTMVYATWVYHPSARSPYPDSPKVMRSVLEQLFAFKP